MLPTSCRDTALTECSCGDFCARRHSGSDRHGVPARRQPGVVVSPISTAPTVPRRVGPARRTCRTGAASRRGACRGCTSTSGSTSHAPRPARQQIHADAFDMQVWLIEVGRELQVNVALDEHDAIAWFQEDELGDLRLAHDSYLAMFAEALAGR